MADALGGIIGAVAAPRREQGKDSAATGKLLTR